MNGPVACRLTTRRTDPPISLRLARWSIRMHTSLGNLASPECNQHPSSRARTSTMRARKLSKDFRWKWSLTFPILEDGRPITRCKPPVRCGSRVIQT
ncbi:hypothetical protein BAUCODRAFT_547699 [Baudoinia panamericana UAMH 10762]|uniref:Uncharacterized protein n=1 Tax=Baudoinia panamericana (strain UAMH 10762) TaxID=717646 RepID=M2N5V4_BAUPA|nr:uncharacterized protein BAUCODRAFT_547699 [Baudoinia panamericana UAMH 10762]EMC94419.1 hypothetical protein BAUCODRAFT_547699 [Baudoinia panamericana UAMH 10762]